VHSHSRRGFLSRMLGAAWASASVLERAALVAARARAQSKEPLPTLFDIEKQTDGIYAAVARGRALINCNAAIFENDKDLLIVDAHAAPSAVFALVAQIRREITQKPVRYVVATHVHGDHTQGLAGYRQISPSVDIIATAKTRSVLAESGAVRLKSAADDAGRSLENLSRRLAQAKTAEEKAWTEEMIRQTRAFQEEIQKVPLEVPNVTFDDHLTLHDKAHELHLSFRGRGHTAGDIVVFCPSKKVIASGDLLHSFFPTISDGYPRDWPGTLRSIQELDFQRVIGGHGSVLESRDRAGQMRAYLEELLEIVARAKQEGVPLEKLLQTITPASLKTLQGGYGDYLTESVKKHDFRVQLNTPAEVMTRGVRDNVTAVFRNFDRR
jgi:cyclase